MKSLLHFSIFFCAAFVLSAGIASSIMNKSIVGYYIPALWFATGCTLIYLIFKKDNEAH